MDDPKYLTSLNFCHTEARTIKEAKDQAEEVMAFANERGLSLTHGGTGLVKEKDPIESVEYGSTEVFRNRLAEHQLAG